MSKYSSSESFLETRDQIAQGLDEVAVLHQRMELLKEQVTTPELLSVAQEALAAREADGFIKIIKSAEQVDTQALAEDNRSLNEEVESVVAFAEAKLAQVRKIAEEAQFIAENVFAYDEAGRERIEQERDRKIAEITDGRGISGLLQAIEDTKATEATLYDHTEPVRRVWPLPRLARIEDIKAQIEAGEKPAEEPAVEAEDVAIGGMQKVKEQEAATRNRYIEFLIATNELVIDSKLVIDTVSPESLDKAQWKTLQGTVKRSLGNKEPRGQYIRKELLDRGILLQEGMRNIVGKTGRPDKVWRKVPLSEYDHSTHDGQQQYEGFKVTWEPIDYPGEQPVEPEQPDTPQPPNSNAEPQVDPESQEGRKPVLSVDDLEVVGTGEDNKSSDYIDSSIDRREHRVSPDREAHQKLINYYLNPKHQGTILLPELIAQDLLDEHTIQTLIQQATDRGEVPMHYVRSRVKVFHTGGYRDLTEGELNKYNLTIQFGTLRKKTIHARTEETHANYRVYRIMKQNGLSIEHFQPEEFEGGRVTWQITQEQKELLARIEAGEEVPEPTLLQGASKNGVKGVTINQRAMAKHRSRLARKAGRDNSNSPVAENSHNVEANGNGLRELAERLMDGAEQVIHELDESGILATTNHQGSSIKVKISNIKNGDELVPVKELFEELRSAKLSIGRNTDLAVRDLVLMKLLPEHHAFLTHESERARELSLRIVERKIKKFYDERASKLRRHGATFAGHLATDLAADR